MGGTIHCEQGNAQWFILPCRCTGCKKRWPGQTRTGDQASLECSSTTALLLLKGAMYVFQFMLNKIPAIRVWTRGLSHPYACVFCYCFVYSISRSCAELFWASSQSLSIVCCMDWSCDSTDKHQNGSQEQRFRNMENMKTDSGTRSKIDSAHVVY